MSQFKTYQSSKIPTEYPLLPAWEKENLTGLHVNETSFGIYTSDMLHHVFSAADGLTTLAILLNATLVQPGLVVLRHQVLTSKETVFYQWLLIKV